MTNISSHFTAVIEITKTSHAEAPRSSGRGYPEPAPASPTREVSEVARVVIRANSIETLRTRVAAHVELVEEV